MTPARRTCAAVVVFLCFAVLPDACAGPSPREQADDTRALYNAYLTSERALRLLPGHMELSWRDIPALLELGKDQAQIETENRSFGRMFVTEVTGQPMAVEQQKHALRGMLALWLVEGIRCGRGESFRPPLYAFCYRGNRSRAECEVAEDIHRDTFSAYQRWWGAVKDLPIDKAAAVDPLAGTSLRWCYPMQPANAPGNAFEALPPVTVAPAKAVEGLPDPPFTIEEVAAYHHEKTSMTLSPEMLMRLYTSIAINNYGHRGDASMKDAARRALAFSQDEPTRFKLYSCLADGYFLRENESPEENRRAATKVLLVSLREMLQHELPDEPPDVPGVGMYNISGPEEAIAEAKKKHDAEMAAHDKAKYIEELVYLRKQITQRIINAYIPPKRTPQALEELRNLALQYLGDESAAKQLHDAAASYHGLGSPVPVLRLTTR